MTKPVLLAVDLSYQTYRAAASHPMLTSGQTFTGGLYGFLTTLAKQIRETGATRVIACRDMKPYRRSLVYPEYKQLRKKDADEDLLRAFNQSMKLVLEVLDIIKVPAMGYEGFESDDCIAWMMHRHRSRFQLVYAASNDSDLFQLFRFDNFKVLRKDLSDLVDRPRLLRSTGLSPEEFMLASALQGTHNDIAGIPGVGPVTALKAVRDPGLMRSYRERWGELIDRNLSLIRLPHTEFPTVGLPAPMTGFSHRDLYRFCGRFDIEVTKSMLDSFQQIAP